MNIFGGLIFFIFGGGGGGSLQNSTIFRGHFYA